MWYTYEAKGRVLVAMVRCGCGQLFEDRQGLHVFAILEKLKSTFTLSIVLVCRGDTSKRAGETDKHKRNGKAEVKRAPQFQIQSRPVRHSCFLRGWASPWAGGQRKSRGGTVTKSIHFDGEWHSTWRGQPPSSPRRLFRVSHFICCLVA